MKYYTYRNGLRNKTLLFIRVERDGEITPFQLDGYSELGYLIKPYKVLKRSLYRVPNKFYGLSNDGLVEKFLEDRREFGQLI